MNLKKNKKNCMQIQKQLSVEAQPGVSECTSINIFGWNSLSPVRTVHLLW